MRSSVSLGRIAGVDIGVNWTWFPVAALVTVTLATGVFPESAEGLDDWAYWAMGTAGALLFFTTLLLHELGHALQARRDRVRIEGITLWLFGGVARFKGMYETPGAEFRIAAAGPLVTVVVAAALFAVAALAELPASVEAVVAYLAAINVLLLVFNLIPALPLDGGRLLHAALWRAKGDLAWATRVGAAIGMGFGFVLIGAGVATFVAGAGFGGLWLAIIGWFLASAAHAESLQILAREALRDVRVADLMAREPVAVPPDLPLGRFMDEVAGAARFTSYPVVEDDRPVGLLTFRCVAGVPRERWDEDDVRTCMLPADRVPVLRADQAAGDAFGEVVGADVHRALVVDDGRLVGLLSITDLARAVQGRDGSE